MASNLSVHQQQWASTFAALQRASQGRKGQEGRENPAVSEGIGEAESALQPQCRPQAGRTFDINSLYQFQIFGKPLATFVFPTLCVCVHARMCLHTFLRNVLSKAF